jgi:hypothetical protein
MPLLNEADEVYIGTDLLPVEEIYLGDTPIWTFSTTFITETLFEPLGAFITGSISTS